MSNEGKSKPLEEPFQNVIGSDCEAALDVMKASDNSHEQLPSTSAHSDNVPFDTRNRLLMSNELHDRLSWFVIILTVSASLGGFLFGYDTGVVSGAMILIAKDFDLTDTQEEIAVSVTVATAAVSSLAGGPAIQRYGRRPVIIFAGLIFTVGAVLLGAAQSYGTLVVGRFIVGIGIGLTSLTTPVYIAEAAPSHLRGRLVTLNTLFITGGQVAAGVVDGLFSTTDGGWRYMLGISGVPAVLMTFGFLFLPESPRWLLVTGRRRQALVTLQKIRGTPDVQMEIQHIINSVNEHVERDRDGQLKPAATIAGLWEDPKIRRALVLGCGLQLLQQLCGINTLMYYSATICSMAGFGDEISIWLSAVTAAAQSAGVCIGIYLIEKCGRRHLVLTSLAMVVGSLTCLGLGFLLYDGSSDEAYGWFVVAAMMMYLFTFGCGMSGVPWVFNAEVYPTHARSFGTSASTTTNWLGNALVSATFLTLADSSLGKAGTFWLYAVMGTVGWVWLKSCMPETKGLKLEVMDRVFTREGDESSRGQIECGSGDTNDGSHLGQHPGAIMSEHYHCQDGFALLDDVSSDER